MMFFPKPLSPEIQETLEGAEREMLGMPDLKLDPREEVVNVFKYTFVEKKNGKVVNKLRGVIKEKNLESAQAIIAYMLNMPMNAWKTSEGQAHYYCTFKHKERPRVEIERYLEMSQGKSMEMEQVTER